MIVFIIAGYTFLIIFNCFPLYKKKLWPDYLINGILGALSLTLAVLLSLNVKIPTPLRPIEHLITLILGR
ncbi:hypothetical protein [Ruminiclostridium josui]|uniref:hypothetical protein n=1 Tax=Ruminiclostridium josui TaxID=1499 RepID=UPI0004630AE2|nr:hypothetical protein [Ruminiclostridium josui]